MPRVLRGMPASGGIVEGPVHLLRWEVPDVRHRIIHDDEVAAEKARFERMAGCTWPIRSLFKTRQNPNRGGGAGTGGGQRPLKRRLPCASARG